MKISTIEALVKDYMLTAESYAHDICGFSGHDDYNKIRNEKFAELIVRECARVDSEENNCDHVDGVTYNQTILEHFGVTR